MESADRLVYEAGYEHTSFATIAADVGISRGNFHHHFKAKDDILASVIDHRIATTTAMLDGWAANDPSPSAQIRCFIDMVAVNQHAIMRHGCPVGSLCAELAKHDHPLFERSGALFELFRDWLRVRFCELGLAEAADGLAMHLLVLSQGVAALANVYKDGQFIEREVAGTHRWLDDVLDGLPRDDASTERK